MTERSLQLTDEDRRQLASLAEEGSPRVATRAEIVLLSGEGKSVESIAADLGCAVITVYKWRRRFRSEGIEGLRDLPRPGQPKKLSSRDADTIVRLTTERLPPPGTLWSIRTLSRLVEVPAHQVRSAWVRAELRPHLHRAFRFVLHEPFRRARLSVVGLRVDTDGAVVALRVGAFGEADQSASGAVDARARGRWERPLERRLRAVEPASPETHRPGTLRPFASLVAALDLPRSGPRCALVFSHDALLNDPAVRRELAARPWLAAYSAVTTEAWLVNAAELLARACGGEAAAAACSELQASLAPEPHGPAGGGSLLWLAPALPGTSAERDRPTRNASREGFSDVSPRDSYVSPARVRVIESTTLPRL